MEIIRNFTISDYQIDEGRLVIGKTHTLVMTDTFIYFTAIGKLKKELKEKYEHQSSFFDNVKDDSNLEIILNRTSDNSNHYELEFRYTEYVSDIKFNVNIEYGHNDEFELGKFLLYKDDLCGINNIDPSIADIIKYAIEPHSKIILCMRKCYTDSTYKRYTVYYKDPNNCIDTLTICVS